MSKTFKDIEFGLTSAEAERSENKELILKGQIDLNNASLKALNGREFLFLGYKGTGKSSLGEKLSIENSYDKFVNLISLGEFPFKDFSKIIPGDKEKEVKLPTTWAWILLIYILESFGKDNGSKHPNPEDDVQRTIAGFREMGFSEDANPADIIRGSAQRNFKFSVKIAEAQYAPSDIRSRSDIPDYVNSLKRFIAKFQSNNKHYVIIDGLDDILTGKEIQYQSLAALLNETQNLNQFFKEKDAPIKIILLCRTDIFDKISTPNKNKLRDYSFQFDWYHDPHKPNDSALAKVAQLRAGLTLPQEVSLFGDIFPPTFGYKKNNTLKQLLELTRHTPRDFLQLLKEIQNFSQPTKVDDNSIISGIREYSTKYFIAEIKDELSGYLNAADIEKLFSSFGKLRKREFTYIELREQLKGTLNEESLLNTLDALYNCSAIGNIERKGLDQNPFYTSKYQNRATKFNTGYNIILHKGLWKALNIG